MINRKFYLYDDENGDKEIKIPVDTAILKLEIPQGVNLTMQGTVDEETGNFYGLMGIKSNDLKSYLSMTEGIFSIDVNGLDVIRCNLDSNGKVMAEMIG